MYVHTQIKQEAINGKFGQSLVFVTHFLLVVSDATCKVWNKSNLCSLILDLEQWNLSSLLVAFGQLGLYSMALKQFSPLLGCVASEQFNPLSLRIWRLIIQSHPRPKPWKQVVTVAWQQLDGIVMGPSHGSKPKSRVSVGVASSRTLTAQ